MTNTKTLKNEAENFIELTQKLMKVPKKELDKELEKVKQKDKKRGKKS